MFSRWRRTPRRKALLEENERLRTENERLQAMLQQDNNDETARESRERQEAQHDERQRQLVPHYGNGERTDMASGLRHRQAAQVVSANNILSLPIDLLGRVLDFLPFDERRAFFVCGSRQLWERIRLEYESFQIYRLAPPTPPPITDMLNMKNLHTLKLGTNCSDAILCDMRHSAVLPNLKHLSMIGSDVTDRGLGYLVENPGRCDTLLSLDITFCYGTTFEVTLFLRDRLINLRVVRRQPEWMDGEARYSSGRRYVYWADGSNVSYGSNGKISDCSYFRNLFEEGSRRQLVAKQQAVVAVEFESEQWQSQPEWFPHALRRGEKFLHLPNTHSVMAAISASHVGTYPVQGFPRFRDANSIPMNSSRCFNRQGERCQRDDPRMYAFVQHYRLQPLNALMPPQDVVNLIRNHVEQEKVVMVGRNQEQDERDVHFRTGGNRSDEPPEYWFQY